MSEFKWIETAKQLPENFTTVLCSDSFNDGDVNTVWTSFRQGSTWYDGKAPKYWTSIPATPKPTPTLRPWRPDEVQLGCWVRRNDDIDYIDIMLSRDKENIYTRRWCYSFAYALTNCEHSTDNGKTWKPCGVLEDAQ